MHIDQGIRFLSSLEAEMEKERKRVERDNLKMSVHNKPILMGVHRDLGTSTLVQRNWSVSEGAITHLRIEEKKLT